MYLGECMWCVPVYMCVNMYVCEYGWMYVAFIQGYIAIELAR